MQHQTKSAIADVLPPSRPSQTGPPNATFVPKTATSAAKTRNLAIDTLRLIAVLGVVCLHAQPFTSERLVGHAHAWLLFGRAISYAARFAVPFFFCASGYFWGRKLRSGANIHAVSLAMVRRLAVIYLVWSAFYLFEEPLRSAVHDRFAGAPGTAVSIQWSQLWGPLLLRGGPSMHLWFLPALICVVLLAWFFMALRKTRLLVGVSIGLYVLAVLARAYSETPIGIRLSIAGHHIDTRGGPFFGSIFFVTGYLLSGYSARRHWVRWGLLLFAAGLLLQPTEIWLIHALLHAPPLGVNQQDFVFGTYAMGLGAIMTALAEPGWLSSLTLARWGRLVLGIYCVHLYFVDRLWQHIRHFNSPLAELLFPIVVLLLSVAAAVLLSKTRLTRSFVQ
jgi:surface polysaccharide O-acyltransferase-like enzyme